MSDAKSESMSFDDLAPRSIDVTLDKVAYKLCEASADAARMWRNLQFTATVVHDGKVAGLGNLADAEALLVSLCLKNSEGKSVNLEVVRSWRYEVVKKLYDKVREMSPSLEEKEDRKALTKRLADIQKKLAEMDREESLPNGSTAGTNTST